MSLLGSYGNNNHVITKTPSLNITSSRAGESGGEALQTFSLSPKTPITYLTSKSKENQESDNDEPPNENLNLMKELDAFNALYSVRCKLFEMVTEGKKTAFKDKGIGQLYVMKLDNGMHQLLIRADNNLGTILLNIGLQEGLPFKKKSPKDIMTMDPVGDGGRKPLMILIRVKSEELANDLLENLVKYSKQSS